MQPYGTRHCGFSHSTSMNLPLHITDIFESRMDRAQRKGIGTTTVPGNLGLMTQQTTVSRAIRLKSSDQTFSGTLFVCHKTSVTRVLFRESEETVDGRDGRYVGAGCHWSSLT